MLLFLYYFLFLLTSQLSTVTLLYAMSQNDLFGIVGAEFFTGRMLFMLSSQQDQSGQIQDLPKERQTMVSAQREPIKGVVRWQNHWWALCSFSYKRGQNFQI